ncbi:hypothetical protein [Rhodoligotrophos ferricapiens]|uniref:hypothetical protein n=1 Tax=Rhodoligotrophos ferricapiens TaxID=3069264 RepID=UPI00315CD419
MDLLEKFRGAFQGAIAGFKDPKRAGEDGSMPARPIPSEQANDSPAQRHERENWAVTSSLQSMLGLVQHQAPAKQQQEEATIQLPELKLKDAEVQAALHSELLKSALLLRDDPLVSTSLTKASVGLSEPAEHREHGPGGRHSHGVPTMLIGKGPAGVDNTPAEVTFVAPETHTLRKIIPFPTHTATAAAADEPPHKSATDKPASADEAPTPRPEAHGGAARFAMDPELPPADDEDSPDKTYYREYLDKVGTNSAGEKAQAKAQEGKSDHSEDARHDHDSLIHDHQSGTAYTHHFDI